MTISLKEKLERWFKPKPSKQSAVALASMIFWLKREIQYENWAEEYHLQKDIVSCALDALPMHIYLCSLAPDKLDIMSKGCNKLFQKYLKTTFNNMQNPQISGQQSMININNLRTPDYRDFLSRAEKISKGKTFTFSDIQIALTYLTHNQDHKNPLLLQLQKGLLHHINGLCRALNTVKHPIFVDCAREMLRPDDGPTTVRDLMACCMFFCARARKRIHSQNLVRQEDVIFYELSNIFENLTNDIPNKEREKLVLEDYAILQQTMETHFVNIEYIPGLIEYFLLHNENKLSARDYADMHKCLIHLRWNLFIETLAENPDLVPANSRQQELRDLYYRTFQDYQAPIKQKNIEEVVRAIEKATFLGDSKRAQKYQTKKLERFHDMRDKRPANMEEIVLHYYQEDEEIRKLRDYYFDEKAMEKIESPKKEFLKNLAAHYREDLLKLGLSDEEINHMKESGQIPKDKDLTIEHIVDRNFGGSNHSHNFILMKGKINREKNDLVQFQQRNIPDADKGCWIISWVPKKNPDGTYPRIFLEDKPLEERKPAAVSYYPDVGFT